MKTMARSLDARITIINNNNNNNNNANNNSFIYPEESNQRKLNRVAGVSQWIILNVLQKHWVQTTVHTICWKWWYNKSLWWVTVLVTTFLEGEIDSDAYSRTNIAAFLMNNRKPCNIDYVFHTLKARDWPMVWGNGYITTWSKRTGIVSVHSLWTSKMTHK